MNQHNFAFRAINEMAASPLEKLEAEAIRIWPCGAESNGLYVLHAGGNDFIYQWGDVMVSRREAVLRAVGRAA